MIQVFFLLVLVAAPPPDITGLLPPNGTPDGWSRSGSPSLYEGGALFDYIDGGADAYYNRGFERLIAQAYFKGDAEVQLEIYDMGSPEGAAAIFAENTSGMDTSDEFGEGSTRDKYQISFFRDRFYVSVLAYSSDDETGNAMTAIARAVDAAIQAP